MGDMEPVDEETKKIEAYRQMLNALTAGVNIPESLQDWEKEVEVSRLLQLRSFITTFLVRNNPASLPANLWELILPALTENELKQPLLQQAGSYLSKPLQGRPSEIAKASGVLKPGNKLSAKAQEFQNTFTPQQNFQKLKILGTV